MPSESLGSPVIIKTSVIVVRVPTILQLAAFATLRWRLSCMGCQLFSLFLKFVFLFVFLTNFLKLSSVYTFMSEKIPTIRCFIAIDLPKEAIEEIQRIQKLIKKQNLVEGKYTAPEHLHLTLKFLGEISQEKVKVVRERLKAIRFKSFNAQLGELGVFSKDCVRIIWTTLEGPGVGELQQSIDTALQDLFPKEQRFMSHITFVRVKKVKDKKALLAFLKTVPIKPSAFSVPGFVLKQSTLTPQGPIYKDLAFYPYSSPIQRKTT